MNIALGKNERQTVVTLHGRFVFECHRDFRSAMNWSIGEPADEIHVDLSRVDYLDSAALGMLLMLGDKARAAGKMVSVNSGRDDIRDLLNIAGIDRMFTVA